MRENTVAEPFGLLNISRSKVWMKNLELPMTSSWILLVIRPCHWVVTARNVPVFGVFLVRIFSYLGKHWIGTRITPSTDTFQAVYFKSSPQKEKIKTVLLSVLNRLERTFILLSFKWKHRNIKIQGRTTVKSLLYWAFWNHYFTSLWISTLMTS